MAQRKRDGATTRELVGFEYDPGLKVYRCTFGSAEKPCGKTYVYDKAAVTHWVNKHTLEHSNNNPVGSTKVIVPDEKLSKERIGGDVVRAIVKDLQSGLINVPDLIMKLNGVAMAMDFLHKELADADIRELTKKANAWDDLVRMLPSIPGVYDMLLEAKDAAHN